MALIMLALMAETLFASCYGSLKPRCPRERCSVTHGAALLINHVLDPLSRILFGVAEQTRLCSSMDGVVRCPLLSVFIFM